MKWIWILPLLAGCPTFDRVAVPNGLPVAAAGDDQIVIGGALVTLEGSGTDPDGDPLTFAWTQVAGDPVELSASDAAQVTFVAPNRTETLVFALAADDGFAEGAADLVRVSVEFNRPPLADAGEPLEVPNRGQLILRGMGADPDGDAIVGWDWAVETGPSMTSSLAAANTRTPVFTPDAKGRYTLSLSVSDGKAWSEKSFVAVTAANNPPVVTPAEAFVQGVRGAPTPLTATASDPDGDPIIGWRWVVTDAPVGGDFTLADADSPNASITLSGRGLYTVTVTAEDDETTSVPVEVRVRAPNAPPIAVATAPATAERGDLVTLDGTGSVDLDGDPLALFEWTQLSGPTVALVGAGPVVTFFAPAFDPNAGVELRFALRVSDGVDFSTPSEVAVRVTPDEQDWVFVVPGAVGTGSGTRADPYGDLASAMADGLASAKNIAMSRGTHTTDVGGDLQPGTGLLGGFDPTSWAFLPEQNDTVITTPLNFLMSPLVRIGSGAGPTIISNLTVRSAGGMTGVDIGMLGPEFISGQSRTIIFCEACRDLTVRDVELEVEAPNPPGPDTSFVLIAYNAVGGLNIQRSNFATDYAPVSHHLMAIVDGSADVVIEGNRFEHHLTGPPALPNGIVALIRQTNPRVLRNEFILDDAASCQDGAGFFLLDFFDCAQAEVRNNVFRMENFFCVNGRGCGVGALGGASIAVTNNLFTGVLPNNPGADFKSGICFASLEQDADTVVANNIFHRLGFGGDGAPHAVANAFFEVTLPWRIGQDDYFMVSEINTIPAQGGPAARDNLAADCDLFDVTTGDYRPRAGSPCIDAGARLSSVPLDDLLGAPRPYDEPAAPNLEDGTDIGPVEVQP